MNLLRFIRKCLTNPPAAWRSAKLVMRHIYGRCYWFVYPERPLLHRLSQGGSILLAPNHSFTYCFWPAVDHYEPDVCRLLKSLLKPGDTFIDCGANIGYFSIQAINLVGKDGMVVAVEAHPQAYELLKQNLELNQSGTAVHCALTSQPGDWELFAPEAGDVYSSLQKTDLMQGQAINQFKVSGRTLDDVIHSLNLSKVDVVKIDVEGGELDILISAPDLLSSFRPIFIVEYSVNTWPRFGATSDSLCSLLDKFNYTLKVYSLGKNNLIDIPENIWDNAYVNLVLIPQEHCKP